jgi:hypothetical protein
MTKSTRRLGLAVLALTSALLPALAETTQSPAPASNAPAPKAVFVETTFDAGLAIKGDVIKHTFEVRNEGNKALSIIEVQPACGCTVVDFDKTVPPGGTGKIHVSVDTANFGGPTVKSVGVLTDDPAAAQTLLNVKCEIRPHLRMNPGYVRYITVQGEKPGDVPQYIWAVDRFADFAITNVESPFDFLTVSFREANAEERAEQLVKDDTIAGRLWRVDTVLATDASVGALTDYVRITTNHPQQKVITIPISGFVRPTIAATPSVLDLGQRSVSETYRVAIFLRNFATEDIKVTSAKVDVAGVTVELAPIAEGRSYNLIVNVTPAIAKGRLAGNITLTTDSPKVPSLVVPLQGLIE